MLAGLDDASALAGDGEGAVEHGLLDSGLHVLVEGCPIRSEGGCVAEGEDYESTVDLSPRAGRKAAGQNKMFFGSHQKIWLCPFRVYS